MQTKYENYSALYKHSLEHRNDFWKNRLEGIDWEKTPETICDESKKPFYRWFPDGTLNITNSCLDRHVLKTPDKVAYYYEGPIAKERYSITYKELLEKVEYFAGVLVSRGVQKGDRAIIYMPMIVETPVAMLACARIGVIHSVVFGGFSAEELANRILDCDPAIILSSSCGLEPHKMIDYPNFIRQAKQISKKNSIPVIYFNRKQNYLKELEEHEFIWQELLKDAKPQKPVTLESNHPLYILYTSGTTGKPKGLYRGTGDTAIGLMLSLELGFGMTSESVMFATSDFGWVVGHSYMVYGPLLFGCQNVIFEGKPVGTPDVGAYFEIIERLKVDIFYSSPTAIRAIRKEDPEAKTISKYDISTLKVAGMVGERTDVHTYEFIKKIAPKSCLYNDTYWQTETGWFLCANFMIPERFPTKGGSCTKPFPGYDVQILSDEGNQIKEGNILGHVVVKMPMPPGFLLSIWGNDEFCKEKYFQKFPGFYTTGDAGYFDKEGYVHIMTRTDDVIQVAGHRLSTAQMEECILNHDDVAECLVVGIEDSFKGEIPYAILVLKKGHERTDEKALYNEIIGIVRSKIGPIACLNNFSVVEKLPKTRSGKILRATVRKILDKKKWDFPATIEDAETLKYIEQIAEKLNVNRDFNDYGYDSELDMKKLKEK